MPRNLELKARVRSIDLCRSIARSLGARRLWNKIQTDTYFRVPTGRLKIREFSAGRAELIAYKRKNVKGSRTSRFEVVPLTDPAPLKLALASTLGVQAIVRKERELYMFKNCRIHLDRVAGLGSFIEFEVMVTRGTDQAKDLMRNVKTEFKIRYRDTVAGSYVDLLTKGFKGTRK